MEFVGKDALRFLGHQGPCPDALREKLAAAARDVLAAAEPARVWRQFPVAVHDSLVTIEGAFSLQSRHLSANLRGCASVYLFVATLGAGVDRLVRRTSLLSAEQTALLQAVAGELTDAWCDDVCAELAALPETGGHALRPRFSPGYGDVPLSLQKDFFAVTDATRRIHVSLTDGFLMVPTKSVSAFCGVCG